MTSFTHHAPNLQRPTLWSYRWNKFRADLAHALTNLHTILRFAPPQVTQLWTGLWAILWGLNQVIHGEAIFANAPKIYAWMHSGPFSYVTPAAWGWTAFGLGIWQWYTLGWPTRDRTRACLRAGTAMARFWTAMFIGFLFSGVPSNATLGYLFLAGQSIWFLGRLLAQAKNGETGS